MAQSTPMTSSTHITENITRNNEEVTAIYLRPDEYAPQVIKNYEKQGYTLVEVANTSCLVMKKQK